MSLSNKVNILDSGQVKKTRLKWLLSLWLLAGILVVGSVTAGKTFLGSRQIADAEFEQLSLELSEDQGNFPSDNLVSNETSFLHVAPIVDFYRKSGQVYIGVGPDQNFSYITRAQPSMAFILDVRRDNLLQHLYFKELFRQSSNRWEFLAFLFGKPLAEDFSPRIDADSVDLVVHFTRSPSNYAAFDQSFQRIWASIRSHFPLLTTDADIKTIRKIALAFFQEDLDLRYRLPGGHTIPTLFPSFGQLMMETDLDGNLGHYLNSEDDFRFLKKLQAENRIVPVVGNFAGKTALRSIGRHLRETGQLVSTFYFSNVEFYLMQNGVYDSFMANLHTIPFADDGLVIRSYFNYWYGYPKHPAASGNYYVTSLAQNAHSLLELHDKSPFIDYWDLVTRDYIDQGKPGVRRMTPY